MNGDGVNDLIVGANGDDEGGGARGAVHIMFMNTDGSVDSTVEINSSTTNGPTLTNSDWFGGAVAKGGKALANRGKDLAYSNSRVDRAVNKIAQTFTPKGKLTEELFEYQKVMERMRSGDIAEANRIVRNLTKSVDRACSSRSASSCNCSRPKERV